MESTLELSKCNQSPEQYIVRLVRIIVLAIRTSFPPEHPNFMKQNLSEFPRYVLGPLKLHVTKYLVGWREKKLIETGLELEGRPVT